MSALAPHRLKPEGGWRWAMPPSWPDPVPHWLQRPGALTTGLRSLGHVDLRVARECMASVGPAEQWMLAPWAGGPAVWLREVVMAIDGRDCVFARSFTPLAASHGPWHHMRQLRTRPLADMLYGNPAIIRSAFYTSRLHAGQPLHQAACHALGQPRQMPPDPLYARGSTFWRGALPLVVLECFLPAFWEHLGA